MLNELVATQINDIAKQFRISTSCFEEADAQFAPREGMHSVARNIAHAGECLVWLVEGAFSAQGFDLDFEAEARREQAQAGSLAAACRHFDACLERAAALLAGRSDEEFLALLPAGPVLGGQPRLAILWSLSDHTASHRGTLGVYARLLGKQPPMPYGEE